MVNENEVLLRENKDRLVSSNLCKEIIEYTSPDEVAVCNLLEERSEDRDVIPAYAGRFTGRAVHRRKARRENGRTAGQPARAQPDRRNYRGSYLQHGRRLCDLQRVNADPAGIALF